MYSTSRTRVGKHYSMFVDAYSFKEGPLIEGHPHTREIQAPQAHLLAGQIHAHRNTSLSPRRPCRTIRGRPVDRALPHCGMDPRWRKWRSPGSVQDQPSRRVRSVPERPEHSSRPHPATAGLKPLNAVCGCITSTEHTPNLSLKMSFIKPVSLPT